MLMILTTQIGAVNQTFHAFTTVEWCMSSQIITETRSVVAVVTETCVMEAVSQYAAVLYAF
jgi:hypothetical protein